ncbi:MAG TPA: HlyD family secretion protein [Rickettsiales bacterium]|nr:HlyD family secretion protein [Rickettsiales bacterium]
MAITSKQSKLLLIVAVVLIAFGGYLFLHAGEESTDDATIDAHVVAISPKVAGYVVKSYLEDNKVVKAGDLLLEIDPRDYVIRRDSARAKLGAAESAYAASGHNLETTRVSAPSNLEAAQAQVDAAQATWQKAKNDLQRMKKLSNEARSREQLDAAVAAEKTSRSNYEDAKARLRSAQTAPKVILSAEAGRAQLAAQVTQAKADLEQAEKDLADTKIYAAQDGRITRRAVEEGDYVQQAQQLGFIVGKQMWVVANFKETQLKNMHPGQPASIHVDAFPSLEIKGKVDSIQAGTGARFSAFPPENATGNFVKIVQRVPVKILFDAPPSSDISLGVGMSVEPTVYTK